MLKMNETGLDWSFLERIEEHLGEEEVIREGLAHEGPGLIMRCLDVPGDALSLRQLAKDVNCSATYLSRVLNGHLICSKTLYVTLSRNLQNRTRIERLTGSRNRSQGRCRRISRKDLRIWASAQMGKARK